MKRYVVVEVDIPEEDADEISAETWMASTLEMVKIWTEQSRNKRWAHGDPVPEHRFRPKVLCELTSDQIPKR